MVVKTKWVTIDVDKLDNIFNVMDKINTAAVRGLIDNEGKELLLANLRAEIPHTILSEKPKAETKPDTSTEQTQEKTAEQPKPSEKK